MNAITVVNAIGGSTNAVLHILAMARSADVEITIDDFQTIANKTPYLADVKYASPPLNIYIVLCHR